MKKSPKQDFFGGVLSTSNFGRLTIGCPSDWKSLVQILFQVVTADNPLHLAKLRTSEPLIGYRYAHDEEDGFAAGERYLPDGMPEPNFYKPVHRGLEIKIADKLEELRKKNAATG